MFADVTSQNIVGYNTVECDATDWESASPIVGLSFTPLAGDTSKLGDFLPEEGTFDPYNDQLQVIDPISLEATTVFMYCDSSLAADIASERGLTPEQTKSLIGWWDAWNEIGEDAGGESMNDYPIIPGYGFMGSFYGGNSIKFKSSGEAPVKPTSVSFEGGMYCPILVNYIPKTIGLGKIVPVDGKLDPYNDQLQVINPAYLEADAVYMYCDKSLADDIGRERGLTPEQSDALIGWWDAWNEIGEDQGGISAKNLPVPPGTGFQGSFYSENDVEFQFPSSLE